MPRKSPGNNTAVNTRKSNVTGTTTTTTTTTTDNNNNNVTGEGSCSGGNKVHSKARIVKDGWGSRANFQASFGLCMGPDSLEEGNRILDAFQKHDKENEHA
ncbi:uncharacterized protein BDCG_07592 [Blastomyces dermatitidis ER-3]|uniref:Uncharacterized protein n=1 Tax=Ajellomyces dermatitidis (strain ER-3 / ATCC MYA-2586) TaxID=559297 RepID=A0ABP2F5W3_AJEDR|nr:uncharacterized protein BDCG_07592 [Blastomyces dermatitidis ER-3]EEQ92472.2 hypothetical protein BDCG_07592 [Blastomyces dermatitidis ER-3]